MDKLREKYSNRVNSLKEIKEKLLSNKVLDDSEKFLVLEIVTEKFKRAAMELANYERRKHGLEPIKWFEYETRFEEEEEEKK